MATKQLPRAPFSMWRAVKTDPSRYFTEEEVAKSKAYMRPLQVVALAGQITGWLITIAFIGLEIPRRVIEATGASAWWLQILVVATALTLVQGLAALPFGVWTEFVHEKKWGFSKQTPGLFAADAVKGFVLGSILSALLFIPLWAVIRTTDLWWVWGALIVLALSLLLNFIYPTVIMPIFNKFTALDREGLKQRLESLAERAGATVTAYQVMDASKRTTHDNAAVAGLGRSKRVILFDNLLEHPEESIEVVVAHELGHYRRGHIRMLLILSPIMTLLVFALINWLTQQEPVLDFAGVDSLADPAALPLFLLLFSLINYAAGFAPSYLSRHNEREADLDALELTGNADAYIELWKKYSAKNLPDLDPIWWNRVRGSHPPVAERMAFAERWRESRTAGN